MKHLVFPVALLATSSLLFAQGGTTPLAFVDVNVVDVMSGDVRREMTVLVAGDRIAAVGTAASMKLPNDTRRVDGSGKFLIPGLWDMHTHALNDGRYVYVLPLMAAKGITGIRDMGTNLPFEEIQQVRRDVYAGRIVGPRVEAWTGAIIDGAESTLRSGTRAATPEEARALVRSYKAAGATFIKPYDLLSPEVYRVLVDEARIHNLPVAGHVPWAMSTADVSELGQRSLEHGFDLLVSLSTEELSLREQAGTEGRTAPHAARSRTELRAIDTYDTRKADELFARFVRNGTWQCPTIINLRWTAIADVAELTGDARQRFLPPMLRQEWAATLERGLPSLGTLEDRTKRFEARVKITGAMYRAGVRLLAGTDSHNPFNYPGWSLHEELEMFVRAGLTPAEALRTATIDAAEFLGRENDFGTIDRGKVADLVLLDENPIVNIGHTQKVHGVMLNGRYLDKSKLAAVLDETAASVLTFKRRE